MLLLLQRQLVPGYVLLFPLLLLRILPILAHSGLLPLRLQLPLMGTAQKTVSFVVGGLGCRLLLQTAAASPTCGHCCFLLTPAAVLYLLVLQLLLAGSCHLSYANATSAAVPPHL